MNVTSLELPGLKLIELRVHRDARGFLMERFNEAEFQRQGIPARFFQDNHSRSAPGVLRGLHFQTGPAQAKLVGVIRGRVWDVAVDLRLDSPTFGKHFAVELNGESGRLLWIPAGFAHGFCVLGNEPADVFYKVDTPYTPSGDGGVHWADPELGIRWPLEQPLVSARDEKLPSFSEYRARPPRW